MLETTKNTESEQRAEAARDKLHGSNQWPVVTHAWFQMRGIQLRCPFVSTSRYAAMHRRIWKLDQA